MARTECWTEEEKLLELLLRLQGPAGEFVFGQLRRSIRLDFHALVHELQRRFRKNRKQYRNEGAGPRPCRMEKPTVQALDVAASVSSDEIDDQRTPSDVSDSTNC